MEKLIALSAFILTAGIMESIDYWYDVISWKFFLLIAFVAVIIILKRKQLNSD